MMSSIGWRMEGWKTYYFLERKNWKCLWKNDSQKGDHFSVRYKGMLRMTEKERKVREKRRGRNEEIERWIGKEERKKSWTKIHYSKLTFHDFMSSFLLLLFFFFLPPLVIFFFVPCWFWNLTLREFKRKTTSNGHVLFHLLLLFFLVKRK